MKMQMVEKMNEASHKYFNDFDEDHPPSRYHVYDDAWSDATKHCLGLTLEILREVLRDETSELTYGAAGQIQNRLHQELDA